MVEYNEEYDRELKDILEKHGSRYGNILRSKGARGRCKDMTYLIDYIYACTKELVDTDDFTYSLATRLYWTINKIESFEDERTHCQLPECKKPIEKWNIVKLLFGYKKTCCKECERKLALLHNEERMMRDYGVKNAFLLQSTIDNNKAHKEEQLTKKRATRLKHFGDENFNNSEQANKTKLKKYGSVFNLSKCTETWNRKYGVNHPMQCPEIAQKAKSTIYMYDGQKFDSSWELALYLYLRDHDIDFVYLPSEPLFWYKGKDNRQHRYFPDFLIDGKIYELKGDNAFDTSGNPIKNGYLDWSEKYECMKKNNVIMLMLKDVKTYLDYVKDTYGKDFINLHKDHMVIH